MCEHSFKATVCAEDGYDLVLCWVHFLIYDKKELSACMNLSPISLFKVIALSLMCNFNLSSCCLDVVLLPQIVLFSDDSKRTRGLR